MTAFTGAVRKIATAGEQRRGMWTAGKAALGFGMRCPACTRTMRPLFTSQVCDWCDGMLSVEWHRGFVVLRDDALLGEVEAYVFKGRTHAAVWRSAVGLGTCPIVEVLSEIPFRWTTTTGSIGGLVIAERPVTIYADHRFPPGRDRAFVAHPEVLSGAPWDGGPLLTG